MTYTMGTLFSGIGVPDLAGRMLGMTTVWQVEKEPYAQKVLRKHFPEAVLHGDVFDCRNLPYVDVVVAGFPCQPFSLAGKRQGERDERYLVPEMLRIIREVKPHVVLFENVPGFASVDDGDTFKLFLRTLAEMGMHAEWGHLSAADFGAPHERERWWCVAYAEDAGINRRQCVAGHDASSSNTAWRESNRNRSNVRVQNVAYAPSAGRRAGLRLQHGSTQAGWQNAQIRRGNRHVTEARTVAVERYRSVGRQGATESRLGRGIDGITDGMDGFRGWPSRPGEPQHEWEPPRVTVKAAANKSARLKALGNSMVLPVVYAVLLNIKSWLEAQDAVGSEVGNG